MTRDTWLGQWRPTQCMAYLTRRHAPTRHNTNKIVVYTRARARTHTHTRTHTHACAHDELAHHTRTHAQSLRTRTRTQRIAADQNRIPPL